MSTNWSQRIVTENIIRITNWVANGDKLPLKEFPLAAVLRSDHMVAMFQHTGYTRAQVTQIATQLRLGSKKRYVGFCIIVFYLGMCANYLLKKCKWTLYRCEVTPAYIFAAWFYSAFKVQNVLTSNDYTVQITGKSAESVKLALAVVPSTAVRLNGLIRVLWSNKVTWLNNRICNIGFMDTNVMWFPRRFSWSHHPYPQRRSWVLWLLLSVTLSGKSQLDWRSLFFLVFFSFFFF